MKIDFIMNGKLKKKKKIEKIRLATFYTQTKKIKFTKSLEKSLVWAFFLENLLHWSTKFRVTLEIS
jgi:prepilin signal peptidase PulO-like enzyme (type II secretory pathway)